LDAGTSSVAGISSTAGVCPKDGLGVKAEIGSDSGTGLDAGIGLKAGIGSDARTGLGAGIWGSNSLENLTKTMHPVMMNNITIPLITIFAHFSGLVVKEISSLLLPHEVFSVH
jgi:hypothetical protein